MAKKKSKKSAGSGAGKLLKGGQPYPLELRLSVVKAIVEGGATKLGAAAAFKVSPSTIHDWIRRYDEGGADALTPSEWKPKKRRADTPAATARRAAVVKTRREHPEWGTRRIEHVLARFEGLGVDQHEVRRILHEEGLIAPTPARGS